MVAGDAGAELDVRGDGDVGAIDPAQPAAHAIATLNAWVLTHHTRLAIPRG
jgi:hypothetical protein